MLLRCNDCEQGLLDELSAYSNARYVFFRRGSSVKSAKKSPGHDDSCGPAVGKSVTCFRKTVNQVNDLEVSDNRPMHPQ